MPNTYNVASVHGRFQPLHNGHMEYILAAKARCDFLWIGITQYNIRALLPSPMDQHREQVADNPLTYFERVQLIMNALNDEGVASDEFGIIPFPIETPVLLPDFLPTNVPVFTTVYDEWNEYKIRELEQAGYQVDVLWKREHKQYVGSEVRAGIMYGNSSWQSLVPPATIAAVQQYELRDRLLLLSGGCNKND